MAIPIDKGIPIPARGRHSVKYPFAQLDVGDSFLYCPETTSHLISQAGNRGLYWGRKLGRKFMARRTPDGIRVWRVE